MSFFGFDSALPRDRDQGAKAPGFGQAPEPFGGLSSYAGADDDDDAYVNSYYCYSTLGTDIELA